jgi:hypothetical protein
MGGGRGNFDSAAGLLGKTAAREASLNGSQIDEATMIARTVAHRCFPRAFITAAVAFTPSRWGHRRVGDAALFSRCRRGR